MLKTWEHTYAASPDDVFEMLSDRAFGSKVNQTQNVVSHKAMTIEFQVGDAWLAGDR